MLEREGASGGAALRHVEQVPGGVALQPYAIRPATLRHVEQVPGGGGPATSTKPGKRATLNHHAKRTANAPG